MVLSGWIFGIVLEFFMLGVDSIIGFISCSSYSGIVLGKNVMGGGFRWILGNLVTSGSCFIVSWN